MKSNPSGSSSRTPRSCDNDLQGNTFESSSEILTEAGLMLRGEYSPQAPLEHRTRGRGCGSLEEGVTLEEAVKLVRLPTTIASDWKRALSEAEAKAYPRSGTLSGALSSLGARGHLSIRFLEWMMGWPIGSSGLEPLGTDGSPLKP